MNAEIFKKEIITKYTLEGDNKFYKSLLIMSLNKLVLINQNSYKGILPHLELLTYHDQLVVLYRREGKEIYLQAAKIFRRAAHKIYRIMLKKKMSQFNHKFLNVV